MKLIPFPKSSCFLPVVFILFLSVMNANAQHSGCGAASDADLTWAESDGLRYEIFVSTLSNKQWSNPVKISDDNANNLHPVLDCGPDGRRWVAWTAIEDSGLSIRYAVKDKNKWSDPQELETGLKSNIAPSLLVDDNNVVWVTWAGNSDSNDEIYFSRFVNGKWEKPQLVNQENDVPDILPVIEEREDKSIRVTWQGYRDGKYVFLESVWDGHKWSPETRLPEDGQPATKSDQSLDKELQLPDFVHDQEQAFMRIYDNF